MRPGEGHDPALARFSFKPKVLGERIKIIL